MLRHTVVRHAHVAPKLQTWTHFRPSKTPGFIPPMLHAPLRLNLSLNNWPRAQLSESTWFYHECTLLILRSNPGSRSIYRNNLVSPTHSVFIPLTCARIRRLSVSPVPCVYLISFPEPRLYPTSRYTETYTSRGKAQSAMSTSDAEPTKQVHRTRSHH